MQVLSEKHHTNQQLQYASFIILWIYGLEQEHKALHFTTVSTHLAKSTLKHGMPFFVQTIIIVVPYIFQFCCDAVFKTFNKHFVPVYIWKMRLDWRKYKLSQGCCFLDGVLHCPLPSMQINCDDSWVQFTPKSRVKETKRRLSNQ